MHLFRHGYVTGYTKSPKTSRKRHAFFVSEKYTMRRNTATKGFKFKLYQKRANGRYAVSLVLRYNGQRLLISLPFSATEMQWDANKERFVDDETARNIIKEQKLTGEDKKKFLSELHPDREVNNMYLDKKTAELLSIVDDYERRRIPFTNMMIQERLFVVLKSSTVEKYLLSHIDKLKVNNRHEKASTFEELYICLKKFDKGFSKRLFPDIDYEYVSRFFENERNSGREVGGIVVNLRALRTLLNSAIKENVGSPETYPFSNQYGTRTGKDAFGLAKEVKTNTRKRYIPFEYLKAFYEFEFETVLHQRSKGFFFFSFFCGGINFTDMANVKQTREAYSLFHLYSLQNKRAD